MTEGMEFERLPEGTEEARDFRDTYAKCPISGVQRALRIWTVMHQYPQGSQAKVLAAMTNIVSEHIEATHALRSKMSGVHKELLEALKAITSHVEDMGNPCSAHCANDSAFNALYEKAISAIARAEAELAKEAQADDYGWAARIM